jgi:hypothetical protein
MEILLPFNNALARDIDMVSYTLTGGEKATLKDVGKVQFTHKIKIAQMCNVNGDSPPFP